ncbi:hypothetical protein [Streptomyces sp. NRRL F-5126]|uniref:hypothetical protein n=1 Tax=Streptomyces sp. NRRL F-5126 TaxID=1463857 RepID=UPI00068DCA40|nr:hypothetical protein [Streptomyces sp. NRRL F-5126]
MRSAESVPLSLTGPASHTIVREPGVGSLTIGPADAGGPRPDLVVGADDTINWSAFDGNTFWPRYLTYRGNDIGFFAWSMKRPVEGVTWIPQAAAEVDASQARIRELSVHLHAVGLDIVLPNDCSSFVAVGDLSQLKSKPAADALCPRLVFRPTTKPSRRADPLSLPNFPALAAATSVSVTVDPLRQAFDCTSLLQFPRTRHVSLRGRLTGLEALARFNDLVGLELRYCPDLSTLPPLDTWPDLTTFIGWNIDEATGKRLRTEIRSLTRTAGRQWEFASAKQLRSPEWFATEYGLPFSGWPAKAARVAVKEYRAAEAGMVASPSLRGAEAAIRAFVRAVNVLPAVETTEREDAAEAVVQLAASAPVDIAVDLALSWFESERDF